MAETGLSSRGWGHIRSGDGGGGLRIPQMSAYLAVGSAPPFRSSSNASILRPVRAGLWCGVGGAQFSERAERERRAASSAHWLLKIDIVSAVSPLLACVAAGW